MVDPQVLTQTETAKSTVLQYRKIKRDINRIQRQFFAVFMLVALLLLLASIWVGMMLAVRLISVPSPNAWRRPSAYAPMTTLCQSTGRKITVEDNGPGFPAELIAKLTEPYVTTRARGTGLGLAISKKSLEEHKATLTLANRDAGGAIVTVVLPKKL